MTLPVPAVHKVTVCETAWEEFALTGPSVIDDGLTQLKAPVDAVAEGETVGLRVGDGVSVAVAVEVGVGVAPLETIEKVSCAPRWVMASLA